MTQYTPFEHDPTKYSLEPWRISPTTTSLLFNFKTAIQTESDALKCITRRFGIGLIACARRLSRPELDEKKWMIIEVRFQTSQARYDALLNGVRYKDETYYPLTTCSQTPEYTALIVHGMPMHTKADAIDYAKVVVVQRVLRTNTEVRPKRPVILHIWLHEIGAIYNGDATVILQGYNTQTGYIDNVTLPFKDAVGYPPMVVSVYRCHVFCDKCHSVNRHKTEDCTNASAEGCPIIKSDSNKSRADDIIVISDEEEEAPLLKPRVIIRRS